MLCFYLQLKRAYDDEAQRAVSLAVKLEDSLAQSRRGAEAVTQLEQLQAHLAALTAERDNLRTQASTSNTSQVNITRQLLRLAPCTAGARHVLLLSSIIILAIAP